MIVMIFSLISNASSRFKLKIEEKEGGMAASHPDNYSLLEKLKRAKEKFSKSKGVNEVQGGHFREEELSQSLIEQYEVEFKTLQVQIKDTYSNLKDKLQNILDQAFEEEHQRLVSDVRWWW